MLLLRLFLLLNLVALSHAQELKVGIVLPFSGPSGAEFSSMIAGVERGIRLQASPVLRNVSLIMRDDAGSASLAVEHVRQLVHQEDVHVIICCTDEQTALAVEPVVRELQVLTLSLAGSAGLATDGMLKSLQPDLLAGLRAVTLGARRHVGDLSLLTPEGEWGEEVEWAFRAGALEAGLPVMRVVRFAAGARPLTPEALLAATSQAEAIVVWADLQDSREAVRSLRARGWEGPVVLDYWQAAALADSSGLGELEFAVPPAMAAGSAYADSANAQQVSAWRVASGAVLSGAETSLEGALLYDALQLATAAFEQALVYGASLTLSSQQVRSAIHDGLVGSGTNALAAGTYRYSADSWSLALPSGMVYSTGRGGRFLPLSP